MITFDYLPNKFYFDEINQTVLLEYGQCAQVIKHDNYYYFSGQYLYKSEIEFCKFKTDLINLYIYDNTKNDWQLIRELPKGKTK